MNGNKGIMALKELCCHCFSLMSIHRFYNACAVTTDNSSLYEQRIEIGTAPITTLRLPL